MCFLHREREREREREKADTDIVGCIAHPFLPRVTQRSLRGEEELPYPVDSQDGEDRRKRDKGSEGKREKDHTLATSLLASSSQSHGPG